MTAISTSYNVSSKQIPNLAFILFEIAHGNQTFHLGKGLRWTWEKDNNDTKANMTNRPPKKSHHIVVIHLKTACEAAQNTKIQNTSVAE